MYGFTTNFKIDSALGKPLTYSTDATETEDDIIKPTVNAVIEYLDEVNSEKDVENSNLPYREGVIIEVDSDGNRVGNLVTDYCYEPYTAQERKAFNER